MSVLWLLAIVVQVPMTKDDAIHYCEEIGRELPKFKSKYQARKILDMIEKLLNEIPLLRNDRDLQASSDSPHFESNL